MLLFTIIATRTEQEDLQTRETAILPSIQEPDTTDYNDRHLPEETLLDSIDAMQFLPVLDPSDAVRIAPGNN